MARTSMTVSLLRTYDGDMTWQRDSECRRLTEDRTPVYDPEIWFPVGTTGPALVQAQYAKSICRTCPVMEQCREWAVAALEDGVAGGLDEDERRALRRERARSAVTA